MYLKNIVSAGGSAWVAKSEATFGHTDHVSVRKARIVGN
jgi:hypothetical protein